jgi:hypothetical protein
LLQEDILGYTKECNFDFDVVLCLDVLEHLPKTDGFRLLSEMERIAQRQVIISTPLGHYEQHGIDDNPYQVHRSQWSVSEFERRGYIVRGVGFPNFGGEDGLVNKVPRALLPLADFGYLLAGVFTYRNPSYAGAIVVVKNLGA